VQGRKNIQAWVQKSIDQGMSNLVLTPTESAISGSIAYEAGTYSATVAPPRGKSVTDKGKYVVVLKQAGGAWLLAHDIFNSDLPPPPPAATPAK
jgi:ketosteroid isomerase-like protein